MDRTTPEQRDLQVEASRVADALTVAEERVTLLRTERVNCMRRMHDAGLPWAEIARRFAVTPQAAMYATGHAKRQSRGKGTSKG